MKKLSIIILVGFTIITFLNSCTKDFEETNTNPNGFTTASDGSLFNSIINSLVLTGNEQMYIENEILYKQTQLAALTSSAWGNFTLGTEDIWGNYYLALCEIRELEKRFSEKNPSTPGLNNMKAMVKILKAYKTFKVTDLFGDIPFSEAGYGFQTLSSIRPKFDTQRDIYLELLDDLAWADQNIDPSVDEDPFKTFVIFDRLLRGDMNKWRKFANSLRLRYAMRMSQKEPQIAGEIIKEIIEDNRPVLEGYNFSVPVLESICLWPLETGFENTSLNWAFREHKNLRMGSNIWHTLSANDSTSGSGIFDPRAYIFFEGNVDNKWIAYPQIPDATTPSSQGEPYGTYRDDPAYFTSKQNCNYSPFNYFIIRDEDKMPIILITGAEVHFLKAEAYLRGIGVAVNESKAGSEYLSGINTSVEWWKNTANNLILPFSGLKFPDWITIPSNLDAASVQNVYGFWNASGYEEKLKFLYTQQWLDEFRQPVEAYSLTRRTGKTPREGNPINHFRLPYPPSEKMYNTANLNQAVARQGGDSPETKIWWIP